MQAAFLGDFRRLVSPARYHAFQNGGTDAEAIARHLWNTALCESLYPLFQILEVGFRNAVHMEISNASGVSQWLLNPPAFLQPRELEVIGKARSGLRKERKPVDEPRMVAKLSFGFWTCLLDSPYDQLWHRSIRQVVPRMPRRTRTRQNLSSHLHSVRKLRNLAFHHHAIWHHPNLKQAHHRSLDVIDWLGASLGPANAVLDRFPVVFEAGVDVFTPHAESLMQADPI